MKKFIPNYWINLISPADMAEDDFEKFHTELGFAMKLLKHRSEDAAELIVQEGHRIVSAETAYFLNAAMKLNLEFGSEPGGADMCKSMEKKEKKDRVTGAIQAYRFDGASDETIITKVMSLFNVTKEYVLDLLAANPA